MGYISDMRARIGHDMLMTVGAGVIVYNGRQVLLQRRRDNGCWAMHGGCLELGEELEQTARRELEEETGLVADSLEMLCTLSGPDRYYTYPNGDEVYMVGMIYLCREFHGELHPQDDEVCELRWFDINKLPEINAPERRAMNTFLRYIESRQTKG